MNSMWGDLGCCKAVVERTGSSLLNVGVVSSRLRLRRAIVECGREYLRKVVLSRMAGEAVSPTDSSERVSEESSSPSVPGEGLLAVPLGLLVRSEVDAAERYSTHSVMALLEACVWSSSTTSCD